jgi:hypothetical protein
MKSFHLAALRSLRLPVILVGGMVLAVLMDVTSLAADPGGSVANPPSVVKGQPSGIGVGDCAPDFQLEPIEISADFNRWLGDKAPGKFEDRIMLSDFVGKAPIVLLFGSFT